MKKILICGGSGFIGRYLQSELIKNNLVTNLDLQEPNFEISSEFFKIDIRNKESVLNNIKGNYDVLYH